MASLRFVRLDQNLEIEIYGEGVENHAPGITVSRTSIRLRGKAVAGAGRPAEKDSRFRPGDFLRANRSCIGAAASFRRFAPTLVRKGIGGVMLLDDDLVEASNLNRQRFYEKDIGRNKALALAGNLQGECIVQTEICGIPLRFEEAVARGIDLSCDVAICGVENNRKGPSPGGNGWQRLAPGCFHTADGDIADRSIPVRRLLRTAKGCHKSPFGHTLPLKVSGKRQSFIPADIFFVEALAIEDCSPQRGRHPGASTPDAFATRVGAICETICRRADAKERFARKKIS